MIYQFFIYYETNNKIVYFRTKINHSLQDSGNLSLDHLLHQQKLKKPIQEVLHRLLMLQQLKKTNPLQTRMQVKLNLVTSSTGNLKEEKQTNF